jgi:dolichol-phosphate mannosyltransferase
MDVNDSAVIGISVVTTTWNERENIEELIQRIRSTLKDDPHEVIVVDDDSPDGTLEVAKSLADLAVGKKNEGQTAGLLFGMRLAKFPIIVTIDSDLENNPELIPSLVEKLSRFDLVVASRTKLPKNIRKTRLQNLGQKVWGFRFFLEF